MKKAIITTSIFFFISLGTLFAQGHEHSPGDFQTEFTELINSYLVLKDALIESDAETALYAASQMKEQLEEIGKHRLEGDDHMAWMEVYDSVESQLNAVTNSTDLDELRTHFLPLSEELAEAAQRFGVERVVYVQHCPMAFDNEGGSWLSREQQIANPYLPDTMLRCGRVIDSIE